MPAAHGPFAHCESRSHTAFVPCGGWQAPPLAPSHQKPVRQFASPATSLVPHAVRHADALAHWKFPAHGPTVPGVQLPVPLHMPSGRNMPALHEVMLHDIVAPGYTHAPVGSQSVAAHWPMPGHEAVQQ
jgi:hypothetical protein